MAPAANPARRSTSRPCNSRHRRSHRHVRRCIRGGGLLPPEGDGDLARDRGLQITPVRSHWFTPDWAACKPSWVTASQEPRRVAAVTDEVGIVERLASDRSARLVMVPKPNTATVISLVIVFIGLFC